MFDDLNVWEYQIRILREMSVPLPRRISMFDSGAVGLARSIHDLSMSIYDLFITKFCCFILFNALKIREHP